MASDAYAFGIIMWEAATRQVIVRVAHFVHIKPNATESDRHDCSLPCHHIESEGRNSNYRIIFSRSQMKRGQANQLPQLQSVIL